MKVVLKYRLSFLSGFDKETGNSVQHPKIRFRSREGTKYATKCKRSSPLKKWFGYQVWFSRVWPGYIRTLGSVGLIKKDSVK